MNRLIKSCKEFATESKEALKTSLTTNQLIGDVPILAIIQVGDNEASNSYVKYKMIDCRYVGIHPILYKLNNDVTNQDIVKLIEMLNDNNDVSGIIVQLPLPSHLNTDLILSYVSSLKDVDGFKSEEYTSCTALGISKWLEANNISELSGRNVTVVGRGITSGSPIAQEMVNKNATVTICHSKTPTDILKKHCLNADIIISCVGKENIIKEDYVSDRTLCIDVGRGDFEISSNRERNIYVTPKIGGTGLLTRLGLLWNTIQAKKNNFWL